jgi:hypothetical protein
MNNEKLLKYLEDKIELKKQNKTELAAQKVELGFIDDVSKKSSKELSKYEDGKDLISIWKSTKTKLLDIKKDVRTVRKSRKAYIIGIEGAIQDLEQDLKYIEKQLQSVGIKASENKQFIEARINYLKLTYLLRDLKNIDDLDEVKI